MSKHTTEAVIEIFDSKLEKILDAIESLRPRVDMIPEIYERIHMLEEKMEMVQLALADTNKDVKRIDRTLNEVVQRLDDIEKDLKGLKKETSKLQHNSGRTRGEQLNLMARLKKLEVQLS